MRNRAWLILIFLALGAALTAIAVPATPGRPQQLVFLEQSALTNGDRVAIFLPAIPIAIGVQSRSGSRVLTVGELVQCQPFAKDTQVFRKAANGDLEGFNVHEELLNCGPPVPGEADRILAVVGIQWREK